MTVLIVAGLLLASLLSRRVRKVLKFARKFLAGHPLDGYHRTNATFTRGATKVLDPRGRAHPWHWRPGWQRGAVRLGAILLAAGVTWGALFHPGGTIGILAIVTAAGVRYTGWRLYRLARRWRYPAWDWHDITRNRRKFAQDTWTAVKRPCVHYWYFRRPGTRSQTRSAPRRPG